MNNMDNRSRKIITILLLIVVFIIGLSLLVVSQWVISNELIQKSLYTLGSLLAISVIVSFLYSVTLRQRDDVARKNEIRELLDDKFEELVKERFKFGLNGFDTEMDYQTLFDGLENGDELWWLDTYAPGHKLWIDNMSKALQRGASIRILALEPSCENANLRASEIGGFYLETFNNELDTFIKDLSKCAKEESSIGHILEIRIYNDLLCVPMYIIVRNNVPIYGYTSFYLGAPTGVKFPHVIWKPSEFGLLYYFLDYIRDKWAKNHRQPQLL